MPALYQKVLTEKLNACMEKRTYEPKLENYKSQINVCLQLIHLF